MAKRTYDQILEEEFRKFKPMERADIMESFEKAGLNTKQQAQYLQAVRQQNKVVDKMVKQYHAKGGALMRPTHIPPKIQYTQKSKEQYEKYYKKAKTESSEKGVNISRGQMTKSNLIAATKTAFGDDVAEEIGQLLEKIPDERLGEIIGEELDDLFDWVTYYIAGDAETYMNAMGELYDRIMTIIAEIEAEKEEKEKEKEEE